MILVSDASLGYGGKEAYLNTAYELVVDVFTVEIATLVIDAGPSPNILVSAV